MTSRGPRVTFVWLYRGWLLDKVCPVGCFQVVRAKPGRSSVKRLEHTKHRLEAGNPSAARGCGFIRKSRLRLAFRHAPGNTSMPDLQHLGAEEQGA